MPVVKLVSVHKAPWRRQLPAWGNRWEDCEFLFDGDDGNYDYLVVFNEPPDVISYTCPRQNTILVVTEPVSCKIYPSFYTRQFGTVISHQEPFAIDHPNVIHGQTALPWFYGIAFGSEGLQTWGATDMGFDDLVTMPPPVKNKVISTVCSFKGADIDAGNYKSAWLFHNHRLAFTQALKRDLPELDFFGRGFNPIKDKADAIGEYAYHLTVENYSCDHWWTEKLADAYLGYALPVYHGCPNLSRYFPEESYIRIDIYNYAEAVRRIKSAIENNEYEKRLPAIIEARRRLLYEYNLFALLHRVINSLSPVAQERRGGKITPIKAYRNQNPLIWFFRSRQYKFIRYQMRRRYMRTKLLELGVLPKSKELAERWRR